jgi:hypothetical protein
MVDGNFVAGKCSELPAEYSELYFPRQKLLLSAIKENLSATN